MEISRHAMQQSALDLLSLARTSSSLRKATRLVGRTEISKHTILPEPGRHLASPERRSPLLQSAVHIMPPLDFPVRGKPGFNSAQLNALPRCFRVHIRPPGCHESIHEYSSSLIIRDVRPRHVEFFDLLEHPIKVTEIKTTKPIPWLPNPGKGDGRTCDDDLIPCLGIQAISLGEIRIVLMQTYLESTFYLLDAQGQPFLTYPLGAMPEIAAAFDYDNAGGGTCDSDQGCRRLCRGPAWLSLNRYDWKALRLPKQEQGGIDPGIFFYHLRHGPARVHWVLITTRSSGDTSESVSSGLIDLASLASSHRERMSLSWRDFGIEILDCAGFILQIHWTEADEIVQILHTPLHSLSNRVPSFAHARIRTSLNHLSTPQEMSQPERDRLRPPSRHHFCISKDALQLISVFPAPGDCHTSILTVHKRTHIDEPWDPCSVRSMAVGPYGCILGITNNRLILTNTVERTVKVFWLQSGEPVADEAFQLLADDGIPRISSILEDEVDGEPAFRVSLAGGLVLLTSEGGLVSGDIVVVRNDGAQYARALDLSQVVHRREKSGHDNLHRHRTSGRQMITVHNDEPLVWHDDRRGGNRLDVQLNDYASRSPSQPVVMTTCKRNDDYSIFSRVAEQVLLIAPGSQSMQYFDVSFNLANCVPFAEGPRHVFSIGRDTLVDFFDPDELVEVLVDSGTDAAYIVPQQQATVVLGRWSGYGRGVRICHPHASSLLFPTSTFAGQRREWYAVAGLTRPVETESTTTTDGYLLHKVLQDSMPDTQDVEWQHIRLFPNWLVDDTGAVYIAGVKRLLAFLA